MGGSSCVPGLPSLSTYSSVTLDSCRIVENDYQHCTDIAAIYNWLCIRFTFIEILGTLLTTSMLAWILALPLLLPLQPW